MKKILITACFTSLINAIDFTELTIRNELYTGYVLTEKESNQYSFIGVTEDEKATIIAAQKRNPYSLKGHNFVQCVLHTNKDKFCFYVDWIAGKCHTNIFRLDEPNPKAFALMLLLISVQAKRSDQTTKRFPKQSYQTEE